MIQLLEQYLVSIFLTTFFVYTPLYVIFYSHTSKYYEIEKIQEQIDNGKSRKKSENIHIILSILFLSAILLFVYRL